VNKGFASLDVVDDDPGGTCEASLSSTGVDVIVAGLPIVDFGEAGSVEVTSLGFVGVTIESALDNAIGGSQAPRQSKAQLAQAGSILLT